MLREEHVRPQAIFNEYLKLAKVDAKLFFEDVEREHINCPACDERGELAFEKSGFSYVSCLNCRTLYVSPRPVSSVFNSYYTEASSVEYWSTTFYRATAEARREKLWKPKVKMIQEKIAKFGNTDSNIIDIGGGYGIFAEEMELLTGQPVTIIEPGPHLATNCRQRGVSVVEKFIEDVSSTDLPTGSRVFVSFELFEHLHDPVQFMRHLFNLMSTDDLLIFTTLSGTGVDIQALWEDSKSVSPPHHLNFLNPYSIKLLLEKVGLKELEIITPGRLDIDILSNNYDNIKDRFWKTFVLHATQETKEQWQQMVANSGWSSHMMICCQKPYY